MNWPQRSFYNACKTSHYIFCVPKIRITWGALLFVKKALRSLTCFSTQLFVSTNQIGYNEWNKGVGGNLAIITSCIYYVFMCQVYIKRHRKKLVLKHRHTLKKDLWFFTSSVKKAQLPPPFSFDRHPYQRPKCSLQGGGVEAIDASWLVKPCTACSVLPSLQEAPSF